MKTSGATGIKLALLGGGQMEEQVRQWVQDRGLVEMVIFLPPVSPEQVGQFLDACDAAVIPIHDRRKLGYCSPLKFYEAIGMGLPVFIPAGMALEEQTLRDLDIPGVFSPDDPADLARVMMAMADGVESYRRRRDEIYRLVDQRYSWDRVAEQVADFMASLCVRKRRP